MALNPITFTERVVEDFLRYQLTAYPLADPDLYAQMRALLRLDESRSTPLRRGPYVSVSRPFEDGASVADLCREGVLHPGMEAVASFPSLRRHQEDAIRAIVAGRTTLVATGTGSGKTEAFLYPIISRCLQLQDQRAPAGVVAVLVYPMNALAMDQLDRLRGLLAGRGVSFGLYVGTTPEGPSDVRGRVMPAGSSNADYRATLAQMRARGEAASLHPAEECVHREGMRSPGGQPRILLTNVKQLELLITRDKDLGILDGAPLQFVVFDEAHTFRGAQGAETACLVRRLRAVCRRRADQVTCIATSATMADPQRGPEAAHDFARRFFGVAAERVTLVGERYAEPQWNERRAVPAPPIGDRADLLQRVLTAIDAPDDAVAERLSQCLVDLGGARLQPLAWQRSLAAQLVSNELVRQLAELLRQPQALDTLCAELSARVGRDVGEGEMLCWLALGAACGRDAVVDPVLRPVVHSFVRGVGGAVVTLGPPVGTVRLWLSGHDAQAELGDEIHRFDLLACTTCGQHYFVNHVQDFELGLAGGPAGGDRVGDRRVWQHLGADQGGSRVLLVHRLIGADDSNDADADPGDEDLDEPDDDDDEAGPPPPAAVTPGNRRLLSMWICRHCGALHEAAGAACLACQRNTPPLRVDTVRNRNPTAGTLHACVACQSPARRPFGGRQREPARPVRAVGVADVHVLAQSMIHLSDRKRLLVFADNRQDAAFQAGWMRDHARRFRLRSLMMQAIGAQGVSLGDVVSHVDEILEADKALSMALVPEVWQMQPFEEGGQRHRQQRQYYLRIQLLRELAAAHKQRLGLEPWGRIRVEYVGLTPELPWIVQWSAELGLPAEQLAEAIAALLDHLRRCRCLHDEQTHLFERVWDNSSKEVQYGFLPATALRPKGCKLRRDAADDRSRVMQWLGSRPTLVSSFGQLLGVDARRLPAFLQELWQSLIDAGLLVSVQLQRRGRSLPGTAGVYQLDAGRLRLRSARQRFRCSRCRRVTIRALPNGACAGWRCGGQLVEDRESADDFDLRLLDGDYALLRAAEHSAQVPAEVRERLENQFKGEGDQTNALVCTPTLELGVDIGALDAILMRNVPPTAANYWQRAGRAGRRHRMAVDLTYAQATGFDQAYFRDPLKLLGGIVEPPRFNLRNLAMVGKHVRATVLTALLQLKRVADAQERAVFEGVLAESFPTTLRSYLFDGAGEVRPQVQDTAALRSLIARHREPIVAAVQAAFRAAWPVEDAQAVAAAALSETVAGMADTLREVLLRFKRRLDWALAELDRLRDTERRQGALDDADSAHRKRCERVVNRFKGTLRRQRSQAQGGSDDSLTMEALAREGFFPGYGLESGAILGSCEAPRGGFGLDDFDLPRPPTLALREFVPGNAIYANGFRFVARNYQLGPTEPMLLEVDAQAQAVHDAGAHRDVATLATTQVRAVPVCDVLLVSQSHISDEEDFRFQMPVAIFAHELRGHRGGQHYSWGSLALRHRRQVRLRQVNVGARSEVGQGTLGYHVCLACGQSHSPFASAASLQKFVDRHRERCGRQVLPTAFYADVDMDVLGLHDVAQTDSAMAHSVVEALRMGAARVLDMEIEDLQLQCIGKPGGQTLDLLLCDPMPGGSGLLDQMLERWPEVCAAARELVENCSSACETACIDCLHTYRNRFYHRQLDRHVAADWLDRCGAALEKGAPIAEDRPRSPGTAGEPQTRIERPFLRMLRAAGLPEPRAGQRIDLGNRYTEPDFFFELDDDNEPGFCIYADGMGVRIHGNDRQAQQDRTLRAMLANRGYVVLELTSADLQDRNVMAGILARIATRLVSRERGREIRADTSWFDPRPPERATPTGRTLRLVWSRADAPRAMPVFDLRIAASALGPAQLATATEFAEVPDGPQAPGQFVARIVGDSMDRVAPDGAWCLWQSLTAADAPAPAVGELLACAVADSVDPEASAVTFKRLVEVDGRRFLQPESTNPAHRSIAVAELDRIVAIARFVAVLVEG